jgi:hypothetical protein
MSVGRIQIFTAVTALSRVEKHNQTFQQGIHGAGYSMLDTGYWILDAGCSKLRIT